ncbi:MAG: hypothetical protein OSA92_05025 [Pirellulaceae bacterium]|nr:hypothetical protein [Pirellulaceae bacterium]
MICKPATTFLIVVLLIAVCYAHDKLLVESIEQAATAAIDPTDIKYWIATR